jgi:hypothetical protein
MSISSVNGDPYEDCLAWRSEVGKKNSMGIKMEEKVPLKTIKITFINLYLSTL